jgi:hypothetical protein
MEFSSFPYNSVKLIKLLPPMINSVNSVFKGIVRLESRLIILLELGKDPDLSERQTLEALANQKGYIDVLRLKRTFTTFASHTESAKGFLCAPDQPATMFLKQPE